MHRSYTSSADLFEITATVCSKERRLWPDFRYVADKVLHDGNHIHDDVLRDLACKWVFLLREPVSAIESMYRTFPHWWSDGGLARCEVLKRACAHYVQRLETLRRYARTIGDPNRCIYFTYSELLDETTSIFELVERYLGLGKSLVDHYDPIPSAQIQGRGDTSWKIQCGRIVREGRSFSDELRNKEISALIPQDVIEAYFRADSDLRRMCGSI